MRIVMPLGTFLLFCGIRRANSLRNLHCRWGHSCYFTELVRTKFALPLGHSCYFAELDELIPYEVCIAAGAFYPIAEIETTKFALPLGALLLFCGIRRANSLRNLHCRWRHSCYFTELVRTKFALPLGTFLLFYGIRQANSLRNLHCRWVLQITVQKNLAE